MLLFIVRFTNIAAKYIEQTKILQYLLKKYHISIILEI